MTMEEEKNERLYICPNLSLGLSKITAKEKGVQMTDLRSKIKNLLINYCNLAGVKKRKTKKKQQTFTLVQLNKLSFSFLRVPTSLVTLLCD